MLMADELNVIRIFDVWCFSFELYRLSKDINSVFLNSTIYQQKSIDNYLACLRRAECAIVRCWLLFTSICSLRENNLCVVFRRKLLFLVYHRYFRWLLNFCLWMQIFRKFLTRCIFYYTLRWLIIFTQWRIYNAR